ncbi:glycosyltransferase family 4 protein [Algoriphagus mannitolivorans]|uniref:glycosyltransferase family 4 protein n=1 Tax=Algoriphagus mannitolivorans TaxID=226504 RepID=UPI0003F5092F|nr:glycosyltransferase family 4 protein [Algoriphagus mannitolivorans]
MGKFLIITCVQHSSDGKDYFGYGPYVREMNLWIRKEEKVCVLAPISDSNVVQKIDLAYQHGNLEFQEVPAFDIQSVRSILKATYQVPYIMVKMLLAMAAADHIHIRIPGNMGLLGMFCQVLFPGKPKTIKYAGNWDPQSRQPLTYRIQRKIANSTILTKNAKVLVYGDWPDSTKNILPFFTASYWEREKESVQKKPLNQGLKLVFVGALYEGKNPIVGLQVSKMLQEKGIDFTFTYCGDGVLRSSLEKISKEWKLEKKVRFLGNVNAEIVKEELKNSHFLIFVSETEGWPKAVAEAMFWGCLPLTSAVSCVPQMVGIQEERGILVSKDPKILVNKLEELKNNPAKFERMSQQAMEWSRNFTLEKFQTEIEKLK